MPSTGPCAGLLHDLTADNPSNTAKREMLRQVEPRFESALPNETEIGTVYCWDKVPTEAGRGGEELHGIAVMDSAGRRVWFVQAPSDIAIENWRELVSELTGLILRETEYGLTSVDP